jgi:predicted outer membrane protein
MQVLLRKHTKLNMHINLYVYKTNTKLSLPTFVTQELYATTTHLKDKENFQSACTKNLQKEKIYIVDISF